MKSASDPIITIQFDKTYFSGIAYVYCMKTEANTAYDIKPLFGYILIKPLTLETVTTTGLYTPDGENKAQVCEVGEGTPLGDGKRLPMAVHTDDIIYYRKDAPKELILINADSYYFIEQRDVVGIVKQYEGSHEPERKETTNGE